MVGSPPRLAASVPLSTETDSRTRAYSGSSRRWNSSDPATMTGMGAKASRVSSHELTANTAPTRATLTTRPMIVGAPTSRKRSSWLTSSLSTASVPPVVRASCQPDVQGLHVPVRLDAQVVLDRLGQPPPEHLRRVVADGLQDPHDDVEGRQPAQLGRAALDPDDVGHERGVAPDDDVDRGADDELRHDVHDLVDHGHGHRGDQARAVDPVAGPQLDQRVGAGGRGGSAHEGQGSHPRACPGPPAVRRPAPRRPRGCPRSCRRPGRSGRRT